MPDGAPRIRGFGYVGLYRYSLTICVHARRAVFASREAVTPVLSEIEHVAGAAGFQILAYCFMPDHVHLLVESESETADLRRFMNVWKQRTAFNYARRGGGRLWQVGYFDHVLRSDEDLGRHILYILGNPVRAGLTQTIGEYPFAGCDPDWLRGPGGHTGGLKASGYP